MVTIPTHFDLQGHRGCRGLMPENSLPAFLRAIDLGCTTLELDVVISADSQVIVSHEPWFSHEFCLDPNGLPIAKTNEPTHNIYRLNASQIRQYDCGTAPHKRFPEQQKIKIHKPLLTEVFTEVETYTKTKGVPSVAYNIEIKYSAKRAGIYHPDIATFVHLVMAEINRAGVGQRCVIQSFDLDVLRFMHEQYSQIPLALLMEIIDSKGIEKDVARLGFVPAIYSPDYHLLQHAEAIEWAHTKGMKVIPWTVNDPDAMRRLLGLGVDGLITDYPDRFRMLAAVKN